MSKIYKQAMSYNYNAFYYVKDTEILFVAWARNKCSAPNDLMVLTNADF